MPTREAEGSWPNPSLQRAFVEGMKWWQFHHNGSTAFRGERDEAEKEALRRYGIPEERTAEWIEIKEGCEMPKDFEDVHVICANGDRAIAWTESDDPNWYETYGGEEPLLKAILWHPFPAAPPEGTHED